MLLNRRETLSALASVSAFTILSPSAAWARSQEKEGGAHSVVPLPFDPAKLEGISEKMIVSHHDFSGVPDDLEQIYERLAATPAHIDKCCHLPFGSVKRRSTHSISFSFIMLRILPVSLAIA